MYQCPTNASECKTSMKRGILSDLFQSKPEIAFFKVIFLFQMTYMGYFMNEIKYRNLRVGCITCKYTSKRPEKLLQMIFVKKKSLCIRSRKNDSVNGMQENVASRRILTKIATSVFHRI